MLRIPALLLGMMLSFAPALAQGPTPMGVWLHDNQRIQIEIAPCKEHLCAKIVWLKNPSDAQGLPLADFRNRKPALRERPVLGLTVMEGLRRTGENSWEGGRIYNPDDGEDYRAKMSMDGDDILQIRAYLLLPLFGRTLVWTRVR